MGLQNWTCAGYLSGDKTSLNLYISMIFNWGILLRLLCFRSMQSAQTAWDHLIVRGYFAHICFEFLVWGYIIYVSPCLNLFQLFSCDVCFVSITCFHEASQSSLHHSGSTINVLLLRLQRCQLTQHILTGVLQTLTTSPITHTHTHTYTIIHEHTQDNDREGKGKREL